MDYVRMLDKKKKPTEDAIERYLGEESAARLRAFEDRLRADYELARELRFPFGDNYGWGYKYSHKRKHLCYAFFENGAFTVTMQIGDHGVQQVEAALPQLLPETQQLWKDRYPCGDNGGWMHCRVLNDAVMDDLFVLLHIKVKPITR